MLALRHVGSVHLSDELGRSSAAGQHEPEYSVASGAPTDAPEPRCSTEWAIIHDGESWYASAPGGTERLYRGAFEQRDVPTTPGGRDHTFFLDDLPVYALPSDERVLAFDGAVVVVRGKLVDLGYGDELWPGAMCRAE